MRTALAKIVIDAFSVRLQLYCLPRGTEKKNTLYHKAFPTLYQRFKVTFRLFKVRRGFFLRISEDCHSCAKTHTHHFRFYVINQSSEIESIRICLTQRTRGLTSEIIPNCPFDNRKRKVPLLCNKYIIHIRGSKLAIYMACAMTNSLHKI